MREILFRGKRVSDGQWVAGSYIRANMHWHEKGIHEDWISPAVFANGGYMNVAQRYAVKGDTVGQYTGLTDKNGKKIFEGDIVKINQPFSSENNGDLLGFVEYRSDIGCFEINLESGKSMYTFLDWAVDQKRGNMILIEVVGNIHDNPELLEAVE